MDSSAPIGSSSESTGETIATVTIVTTAAGVPVSELDDAAYVREYLFKTILKRNVRSQHEFEVHMKSLLKSSRAVKRAEFENCEEARDRNYTAIPVGSLPGGKRVALLICGHFRNFNDDGIRNKYKRIMEDYPSGVDIFIHTWSDLGLRAPGVWINTTDDRIPDFETIRSTLNPKMITIENGREMIDSFGLAARRPEHKLYYCSGQPCNSTVDFSKFIVSQLYSIYTANELRRRYESDNGFKYDLVVKIRADMPPDRVDLGAMVALDLNAHTMWANNSHRHRHPGGGGGCLTCDDEYIHGRIREHKNHTNDVCDIYFYGGSDIMNIYASLYLRVDEMAEYFHKYNEQLNTCSCVEIRGCGVMVRHSRCFEKRYKCIYPERMVREYMRDVWILSDNMHITHF
jgi:hypothetical protein